MGSKTIRLEDFGRELRRDFDTTNAEVQKGIFKGALASIPDLVKASPVDTGQYASSWDVTKTKEAVVIGNFAPHAPIIENGARPFTPPLGPLLAWAKRVLGDSSQPPNYSDAVWNLAKGTQRKIEREGIKPRKVLVNTIPVIIENIKRELKRG